MEKITLGEKSKHFDFECGDCLIKVIDEIMAERPELFKELAKK